MADADPYRYFRVEAAELLERLDQGALAIDKGGEVPGGVSALLRYAHTLKGAARVVKQLEIAEHAHTIEDVLAPHRSATSVPRECGAALRSSLDAIGVRLSTLGSSPAEVQVAPNADRPPRSGKTEEPAVVLRAEVAEVEAVVDGLGESLVELTSLDSPLGLIEKTRQLAELLGRQLAAPRRADPEKLGQLLDRSQRVAEDLRLGLSRLDNGLRHGIGRLRRQLEQTHTAAERLRLVPAGSIFTPLERAAYDAARELGRPVSFITSGGDVKLDSHVLVVAQGAFLHVVRNAVAHGLEPESTRLAARKPAHGSIWLSVARQGRDVVFTCRDDGAGVDLDRVRRALSQRGEAPLSDDQALTRLLQGGISTSERLTRLSGRGVGLDVVRAASEQLGGSVQLRSVRGQGFSVELRAPLSVAAVSAVSVECAGKTLSVPLDAIVESVRFKRAEIARAGAHESVCHEGQVLPFAPLSKIMGVASRVSPPMLTSLTALIIKGAQGRAAVGVDRLLGARTVVIRPVPDVAGAHPIVAGATLDALGNPELVLDSDALVASIQRSLATAVPTAVSRPILVIDDSLTTRMLEQSILESAGYEVALATSAEEGLEKARQHPYALFLVDVEMPGIDGFTFVDRVRHDPALANVPAVLVSSRSAPEDFERGKQVGAHGYIVKGRFDQRELLGLIERLVSN
jgi:two-component system, chemotaxis family, sensor kinase CheA